MPESPCINCYIRKAYAERYNKHFEGKSCPFYPYDCKAYPAYLKELDKNESSPGRPV